MYFQTRVALQTRNEEQAMHRQGVRALIVPAALSCLLLTSACAGGGGPGSSCLAIRNAAKLVYPAPNAVGVDPSIGVIIVGGAALTDTLLLSSFGDEVGVGPLGAPPSPLPSGVPTPPPGVTASQEYEAGRVPQLATETAYDVTDGWSDCGGQHSQSIGTFTTL